MQCVLNARWVVPAGALLDLRHSAVQLHPAEEGVIMLLLLLCGLRRCCKAEAVWFGFLQDKTVLIVDSANRPGTLVEVRQAAAAAWQGTLAA